MWMVKNNTASPISVKRNTPPAGFLILLSLLIVACNAFVAWVVWHDTQAYSYSATPGKIVANNIDERWSSGGRKPRGRNLHFAVLVEYTYLVGDKTIKSEGIRFADTTSNTRHGAELILAAYPVGSDVVVYFNPDRPETSVLVRGIAVSSVFWVLALLLLNPAFLGLVCYKVFPEKTHALLRTSWQFVTRQFGKPTTG
jgi:hypothetical protein